MEAHYLCWDGPCEGQLVTDCPVDAMLGQSCAMPWTNAEGKPRYAVYILLERSAGQRGLVYERSYDTKMGAQRRVEFLTYRVRAMIGGATN